MTACVGLCAAFADGVGGKISDRPRPVFEGRLADSNPLYKISRI